MNKGTTFRGIAFTLALLLLSTALLAACGKASSTPTTTTSTTTKTSTTTTSSSSTTTTAAPVSITLKLSSVAVITAPYWMGVAKWADLVEERTNKQVTFQRFPAGQLYSDAESEYKALGQGLVDAAGVFGTQLGGIKPGLDWASIPGAVTLDNWIEVNKAVAPAISEYLAADNIKLVGHSYNGSPLDVIFSSKVQFKSLEDFKGQKVFSHGKWQMSVAQANGGAPVSMPLGDVYSGLQRGQVDMVWSAAAGGPQAYKWNEQAPYISARLYGGIAGYYIVMNANSWNKIPANIQAIMSKAAEDAAAWAVDYNKNNDKVQVEACKAAAKNWYEIPAAESAAMAAKAREILWPEYVKIGPVAVKIKGIVDGFQKK